MTIAVTTWPWLKLDSSETFHKILCLQSLENGIWVKVLQLPSAGFLPIMLFLLLSIMSSYWLHQAAAELDFS
jgi:hypothetical protein